MRRHLLRHPRRLLRSGAAFFAPSPTADALLHVLVASALVVIVVKHFIIAQIPTVVISIVLIIIKIVVVLIKIVIIIGPIGPSPVSHAIICCGNSRRLCGRR